MKKMPALKSAGPTPVGKRLSTTHRLRQRNRRQLQKNGPTLAGKKPLWTPLFWKPSPHRTDNRPAPMGYTNRASTTGQ